MNKPHPLPAATEALATLQSDASDQEKARALAALGYSADADTVPAVSALLLHPTLADRARDVLEKTNIPAATEALREAAAKTNGRLLVGLIRSLGRKRDAASLPLFAAHVRGDTMGAAGAAIEALGRIGDDPAIGILKEALGHSETPRRSEAACALLLACPNRADAASLRAAILAADLPEHLHRAAREGPIARTMLFNGRDFEGWEGPAEWFKATDGLIVAGSRERPIPRNEFLATREEYGDFELRVSVRIVGGVGNGGIQFRSQREPSGSGMIGYQADAAGEYWGGLYDEGRRGKFLAPRPDPAALARFLQPGGWNRYVIRCEGRRVRLWLNGHLTADFTEEDSAIPTKGRIAVQIHGGPPAEIRYKDLDILLF